MLNLLTEWKLSQKLLMLVICINLSACGFHFRDTVSLDATDKIVYLDAPRGSFEQQLLDDLRIAGAQLTNEKSASDWHVRISQARSRREIGTLNERGTVDSYKLNFTVTYSVLDVENKILRSPQTLTESRQYVYDPASIIEVEFEEEALRNGMEKEISSRIIRQLHELNAISN